MAPRIPVRGRRRGVLLLLFLAFAAAGVAWAVWWHLVGRWHESTDTFQVRVQSHRIRGREVVREPPVARTHVDRDGFVPGA